MSLRFKILILIFSLILYIINLCLVKKEKILKKYALYWCSVATILSVIVIVPKTIFLIQKIINIDTVFTVIIGMLLCLLLFLNLIFTIVLSKQKKELVILNQEISMLKSKIDKKCM